MSVIIARASSVLLHPKTAACAECVYAAHQIADAYERNSVLVIVIYTILLMIAIAHILTHARIPE